MNRDTPQSRGISPVVGSVLLVAIAVVIVSVAGYVLLGATETHDPAPAVTVELEETDRPGVYILRYESGNAALGNQTEIQGVIETDAFHGRNVTASDGVAVTPLETEVRLVWHADHRSYALDTYPVDPVLDDISRADIDHTCDWAEQEINDQGDLNMNDGEVLHCDVVDELDLDPGVTDVAVDLWADATLIGSIDTDGDVDLDSATVTGHVIADANDITVTDESVVHGDVVARPNTNIDIDGNSRVGGAVVAESGSLSLDSVTVDGHIYADADDLSCSGGTTVGPDETPCGEYDPRDPGSY